jgi:P4 family phage/plasmid primase-like protien
MSSLSNPDAERAILGGILLNNEAFLEASPLLKAKDFALDSNGRIYARMADLANSWRPIDQVTLPEELNKHGELEMVGGHAYIASLLDGVPDRPSILHYVKIVRDAADRRLAAKTIEGLQRAVTDPRVSTSALGELGGALAQIPAGEPISPRFSEDDLALRFSRNYAHDWRYVHDWGTWMRWDGMRWVKENTLRVFDLTRRICREASAECGDSEKFRASKLASRATSAAVERLAASDRDHAATVKQWDADPWLLNTPTGTIDLHTGEIRKHRRADYLTKITAAGPGGDCRQWLQFLDRVTASDSELQAFLQRMIGYCLTGVTRDHALFFLYGTGANGKSVFLSTISELLGDYARTAAPSSFTASAIEQHPTDLAGLRGARFVMAIETEDGARWAESKIKSLTGGDKVTARFMRGDYFEFIPEFKLVIAGNHKPGLRSVDEAIRRRLNLVPFTVTIPKVERDSRLSEKLRSEFSGILKWALQGCLDWQKQGLSAPSGVRAATEEYVAAEDAIGRWLEERCTRNKGDWATSSDLFLDWKAWCSQTGEQEGSQKRFSQQLEGRGFMRQRTNRSKGFAGIALRRTLVPDVPDSPISSVSRARAQTVYIERSGTSGTDSAIIDPQRIPL